VRHDLFSNSALSGDEHLRVGASRAFDLLLDLAHCDTHPDQQPSHFH
jgi:hypothetical protein